MASFLWALPAALAAVTAEVLFRRGWTWEGHMWLFVPIAIAINYSIYRLVSSGPTLIVAVATFTLATLVARVLASHYLLGEAITRGNLVAVGALGVGILAGYLWR